LTKEKIQMEGIEMKKILTVSSVLLFSAMVYGSHPSFILPNNSNTSVKIFRCPAKVLDVPRRNSGTSREDSGVSRKLAGVCFDFFPEAPWSSSTPFPRRNSDTSREDSGVSAIDQAFAAADDYFKNEASGQSRVRRGTGWPEVSVHQLLENEHDDDLEAAIKASLMDPKQKAVNRERLLRIQHNLPEGMVVFDVPGDGLCGYYAFQVLREVREFPRESIIRVTMDNVRRGIGNMSTQIRHLAGELEQRELDGGQIDEDSSIAILRAALLSDRRYSEYIDTSGNFNWLWFCEDLIRGLIWFDYSFFPFAREAWRLHSNVECVNSANLQTLRSLSPRGALVRVGGNHFVVVLPETTSNGVKIAEVMCEDQEGQWWCSTVGEPASMVQSSGPDGNQNAAPYDDMFSFTEDGNDGQGKATDSWAERIEKLSAIQWALHENMRLFDLPDPGSGYYALLAIQSFHAFPSNPIITIPDENANMVPVELAKIIKNEVLSGNFESLQALFSAEYGQYVQHRHGENIMNWEKFTDDLRGRKVQLGSALLPFAIRILELPQDITIVSSDDVAELGKFYPNGVLIRSSNHHTMVALPKTTSGKVEITAIRYCGQNGQWFDIEIGNAAILEEE
jgi:hypothetical protein